MRKQFFSTLILILCFCFSGHPQTGKLTEVEFNHSLKDIWQNNPNKIAHRKAIQLCLSNPDSPSALLNLYFLRKRISKGKLTNALNTIGPTLSSNEYAKSLRYYIDHEQLKIGDHCSDFKAQTYSGQSFVLSEVIHQKDVLVIFGGLNCLGKEAVGYYVDLYSQLDKEKVEIISFLYAENKEQLAPESMKYFNPWPVVSDLKGDHSLTKINYNAQGTPTFEYINSKGRILEMKEGPSPKSIKLLKKHIYKKS
jgi:hypothetical protein